MRDAALWAGTVVVALLSAACGHAPAVSPDPVGQVPAVTPIAAAPVPAGVAMAPAGADGDTVGVRDALAAPPGSVLRVTGRFAGWSGGCSGGPPRTRADWMLVDTAGRCLYVSGRVPDGIVPPPDSTSNGTAVTVTVRREATPDGRPYLMRTP